MGKRCSRKTRKRLKRTGILIAIFGMCLISILPYLWMVLISIKDKVLVYQPDVWFFFFFFENYKIIFQKHDLGTYMVNSAIVAGCNCVISLIFGCLTAYSLARHRFRHKEKFAFFLTFIRILPAVASVIPAFVIAAALRVLDTHGVLIVVYLLFNVPFTVLMMRGFFEEISKDIEEAAMIDGCSTPKMLIKIVIPLAMPGIVATAIFCIINAWNEFLYAMLLSTFRASLVPTFLHMFKTVTGVIWGEMSAVGTISTLPVLIFAILVQKHMVRGLSFGAVKD